MTLRKMLKIREYIDGLDGIRCFPDAKSLIAYDKELRSYLGIDYNNRSPISYFDVAKPLSNAEIRQKVDCISALLEGLLSEDQQYEKVDSIIDLILEGEKLDRSFKSRQKFLAKVCYSYDDIIKLGSDVEYFAKDDTAILTEGIPDEMIFGVINKLKNYAEQILQSNAGRISESTPITNISVSQIQNQTQSQKVEITLSQTLGELYKSGLSDEDLCKLTKLLTEYENERKSKNKDSLWEKAKSVMKYLFDKSINIGIAVLPYIVSTLH